MLLDLLDLVIIVSDLLESLQALLVQQAETFSLSTFCVLTIVGLVLYGCWVFTDVPNLPNPPQPPYVIQIRASSNVNTNVGDGRQNLSDVRLLSNGTFDTVLSSLPGGYSRLAQQQQQSNSDTRGATAGEENNQNRAIFFGFLRRPTTRSLIPIRPAVRSNFPGSNVVVYHHQVNVYHAVHQDPDGQRERPEVSSRNEGDSASTANRSSNESSTLRGTQTVSYIGESAVVPGIVSENTQASPIDTLQHDVASQDSPDCRSQAQTEIQNTGESSASCSPKSNPHQVNEHSGSSSSSPNKSDLRCESVGTIDGRTEFAIRNSNVEGSLPVVSPAGPAKIKPENIEDSQRSNMSSRGEVVGSTVSGASQIPSLTEDDIRITIKFLNDTQMDVITQLKEKIFDFKRRHFATELDENKIVRLIFNGRVLDNDGKTLRDFGVFDQCVMHCLIISPEVSGRQPDTGNFNRADSSHNSRFSRSIQGGPEPGLFFVSILGVVLLFLWFICFHFGQQLFTQSAVISLVVLTAVFVIGLVALYLPVQPNH